MVPGAISLVAMNARRV